MSFIEASQVLGNLGEFVGSLAVVATLFYLAVQVRQSKKSTEANTRALEEGRRLALAQTYQARAEVRIHQLQMDAESEYVTPIIDRLEEAGWPQDRRAAEALSSLERRRLRAWLTAAQRQIDNYHYQYQQGFISEEYWENVIVGAIRHLAPRWHEIEVSGFRPSFREAVDRILAEEPQDGS